VLKRLVREGDQWYGLAPLARPLLIYDHKKTNTHPTLPPYLFTPSLASIPQASKSSRSTEGSTSSSPLFHGSAVPTAFWVYPTSLSVRCAYFWLRSSGLSKPPARASWGTLVIW